MDYSLMTTDELRLINPNKLSDDELLRVMERIKQIKREREEAQ